MSVNGDDTHHKKLLYTPIRKGDDTHRKKHYCGR